MQFGLSHIAEITGGSIIQNGHEGKFVVSYFITDSRKVRRPAKSMFVALPTKVRDGHNYIEAAYAQGVRCFLVSKSSVVLPKFVGASFIQVTDTLRALQALTQAHRSQFDIPIYGITGSNG